MNSGTSRRTSVMSRAAPVTAGIALHRGEWIGDAVAARLVEEADLLPEPAAIGDALLGVRAHRGSSGILGIVHVVVRCASPVRRRRARVSSRYPRSMTRRLSATTRSPSLRELLRELLADAGEQLRFVESVPLRERRHGEERAHERRALHPIAQLDVRRLAAGDGEPVEHVDANLPFLDLALRRCRQQRPASSGACRSEYERAAVGQARPSGFEWRKTFGSGDSTTSTCCSSQLRRIGCGANVA